MLKQLELSFEDVNLTAMEDMRRTFSLEVGYSDHTKGIEIPVAAVALGATVIEKHFTLDKNTVKRPGEGISPMQWETVLGKKAIRDFEPDELIEL